MPKSHKLFNRNSQRTGLVLTAASAPASPDLSGYLVYDAFNRANGPVGNAETGQPWLVWPIDPSYPATITDHTLVTNGVHAAIDIGQATADIRLTLGTPANANDGPTIIFHADISTGDTFITYGSNNFGYNFLVGAYVIRFAQRVDGSFIQTDIISATRPAPVAGGVLRLVLTDVGYAEYINDEPLVSGPFPVGYTPVSFYYGAQDYDMGPNQIALFTIQ